MGHTGIVFLLLTICSREVHSAASRKEEAINFQNFWKEKLTKQIDGSYLLTTYYLFPRNPKKNQTSVDDVSSSKYIPRDCSDIHRLHPKKASGLYRVYPIGGEGHIVDCDMDTNGGGWTVIQRRFNGKTEFYRPWKDYKNGFGSVDGEFWLGNDAIHEITAHGHHEIRFDLEDFDGNKRYAKYGTFRIENEASGYKLTTGGYSGNAGDAFTYQNGMKFTTKDRDQDEYSKNCAGVKKNNDPRRILTGGSLFFIEK